MEFSVTNDGFLQYLVETQHSDGHVNLFAFFVDDEVKLSDNVTLDLGVRIEHKRIDGRNEKRGDNPFPNPAGINFGRPGNQVIGTGAYTPFETNVTDWAASVGANVKLTSRTALFGRFTKGYGTTNYIDFITNDPTQAPQTDVNVFQAEAGFKVASDRLGLFASLFYASLGNLSFLNVSFGPDNTVIYDTVFEKT